MPASRPPVIVVAPDSFKGSLDAPAICAAVARGLRRVWADAEVRACPMADGGEGTLAAVLSRGGERRMHSVSGAGGTQRAAAYGIVAAPEGTTAIIEAAEIVGITDPDGMAVAVSARSTGGVGELIVALLDAGVRRFMIGLGGSSTNDGGAGMLAALGLRLAAGNGDAVAPTPAGLATPRVGRRRRTRPEAWRVRDHDHVGRQQPALRRARRDGDLRAAEGRSRRRGRAD